MDVSTASLRVLRAVAERGSFSAAAAALGYTQSGISRQVASLERETDAVLFERRRSGVRLTPAGSLLLRHAAVALNELESAERALSDAAAIEHIRLGAYLSAAGTLLPRALPVLRQRGDVRVTTREGTTPTLVKAVRAGALDLAVVTTRPPHRPLDRESPALAVETLGEAALLVAAPAHGAFAGRTSVRLAELADCDWIASPSTADGTLLGVWPGLPGRPRIAHHARDWLTKLSLVAAGCGVTTVPPGLTGSLPVGVIALHVSDGPAELRRAVLVRMPGTPSPALETVLAALRTAAG